MQMDPYAVGNYVDAKDSTNKWMVATVVEEVRESNQVKIHYEGWSQKWDLYIYKNSNKLAPFRKYTRCYTGQEKAAIRTGKLNAGEIKKVIAKLQLYNRGQMGTPHEVTQFLRGEVFTLVDVLLVTNTSKKVDLDVFYELFLTVITYIVHWLERAADLFPRYYEARRRDNLYLQDSDVACACAWPELLMTLSRLFGLDPRTSQFCKKQTYIPEGYEPSPNTNLNVPDVDRPIAFFLNYFCKVGGFKALAAIFSEEREDSKAPLEFLGDLKFPNLQSLLSQELRNWLYGCAVKAVTSKRDNLTALELKDLSKEKAAFLLHNASRMLNSLSSLHNSQEFNQDIELSLCLQLFYCPLLEKRIKGLSDIKAVLNKATSQRQQVRFNGEFLSAWLIDNRIIEAIFKESAHTELIKRSGELISFLIDHGKLSDTHLEMIWKCSIGKHKSFTSEIYKLVVELASKLTDTQNRRLLLCIEQTQAAERDEKFLTFIKDFTIAALENPKCSRDATNWFGMSILKQTMESRHSSLETISLTTGLVADLLVKPVCSTILMDLSKLAVKRIERNEMVPQSYDLLLEIIRRLPSARTKAAPLSKSEFIEQLVQECAMSGYGRLAMDESTRYFQNLVIKDLRRYKAQLNTAHASGSSKAALVSPFSHSKQLKCRLRFIDYMLAHVKGAFQMDIELFGNLFRAFLDNPVTPKDPSVFYKWLSSMELSLMVHLVEVFDNYFASRELQVNSLTAEGFACFEKFFLACNSEKRGIELKNNSLKNRLKLELKGMPKVYEIALFTHDISVAKRAMELIVKLTKRVRAAEKRRYFENFVANCLKCMRESRVDRVITRVLQMLLLSLDDEDYSHEYKPDMLVYVYYERDKDLLNIHISQKDKVGRLRKMVAEALRVEVEQVRIIIHETLYETSDDDQLLGSIPQFSICRAEVKPQTGVTEVSSNLMGDSQDFMEYLLDLLSKPQKEYLEDAWTLLARLPTYQKLREDILNFRLPLGTLFSSPSVYHVLYSLLICKELSLESQWFSAFYTQGGMREIVDAYQRLDVPESVSMPVASMYHGTVLDLATQARNISSWLCEPPLSTKFFKTLKWLIEQMINKNYSEIVFGLIEKLMQSNFIPTESLSQIIDTSVENLESHAARDQEGDDNYLINTLKLLTHLLSLLPEKIEDKHVTMVLDSCLFGRDPTRPPKCLRTSSKKEAYALLLVCCKFKPESIVRVADYVNPFFEDPSWRTNRISAWTIPITTMEHSRTGYVGLKNLGSTCYLNSTLMQLFMIPSFRNGILSLSLKPDPDNVLRQLKYVFSALDKSSKAVFSPKKFIQSFKDSAGKALNPSEQMDANEFLLNLLDKADHKLKGTPNHDLIFQHFGGIIASEVIGQGSCPHFSEKDEPSTTLNVEVKNMKSLTNSLESYIRGELLEGENSYFCEQCDCRVSAVKRTCIKQLPNILIIIMPRIAFDYDLMTRKKLNDYCEFPLDLDMTPYTQEALRQKDLLNRGEDAPPLKFGEDYYKYKLKGIVVHMGTAEAGHYYSFIQDRDSGKWLNFNDTQVSYFDPDDIPSEAFGGYEMWSVQGVHSKIFEEKMRNAYMLVYERREFFDASAIADLEVLRPLAIAKDVRISRRVREGGERQQTHLSLFCAEFFEFVRELVTLKHLKVPKFLLKFILTTLIRSKEKAHLGFFIHKAKEFIQDNSVLAAWLLEVVTSDCVLKELLLDCPSTEMRGVVEELAGGAAEKLFDTVEFVKAFKCLVNNIKWAKKPESRCYSHFFKLMSRMYEVMTPKLANDIDLFPHLLYNLKDGVLDVPGFECPNNFLDIYLGYDRCAVKPSKPEHKPGLNQVNKAFSLKMMCILLPTLANAQKAQFLEKGLAEKLSLECISKQGGRHLGRLYSILSFSNCQAAAPLVEAVCKNVKFYESTYVSLFLRQLKPMITDNCDCYSERLNYIMMKYMATLEELAKFIFNLIEAVAWLAKAASYNPEVKHWINRMVDSFRKFEVYINKHILNSPANDKLRSPKYTEKLALFTKLLDNPFSDLTAGYDSDDDLSSYAVSTGVNLDVMSKSGKWVVGTVIESTDDLLKIEYDEMPTTPAKWYLKISEDLLPPGCKTKLKR
mmetsp:Transcript_19956/g.36937  ORF Transcript_19956/g.36937 Transcript_19956/m.36937 type:complete len:2099 (-) Transcript_19956:32-6328(-)